MRIVGGSPPQALAVDYRLDMVGSNSGDKLGELSAERS